MQNENVAKTNGESNNFEGRMIAKSETNETQWKYVAFLTITNRRVRQTNRKRNASATVQNWRNRP